jgi:hypothetical protein
MLMLLRMLAVAGGVSTPRYGLVYPRDGVKQNRSVVVGE